MHIQTIYAAFNKNTCRSPDDVRLLVASVRLQVLQPPLRVILQFIVMEFALACWLG